jgi:hypothetical protein
VDGIAETATPAAAPRLPHLAKPLLPARDIGYEIEGMSIVVEGTSRGGGGIGRLATSVSSVESRLLEEGSECACDPGLKSIFHRNLVEAIRPRPKLGNETRESTQRSSTMCSVQYHVVTSCSLVVWFVMPTKS